MSKNRYINTRFWYDSYISTLDPSEKLLFLYFITNQYSDLCGIYEIPLKNVSVDTGLNQEVVKIIIDRFERDGKIFYYNGWVMIKNFNKHQAVNDNIQKGIKRSLSEIPKEINAHFSQKEIGFESLSKASKAFGIPILKPKPILTPKLNIASWSLAESLEAMRSGDKRMQIIEAYWKHKGIEPQNKQQYQSALKRELRAVGDLTGYPMERIIKTMYALNGWHIKDTPVQWKLETVLNYIDKDLTQLGQQYAVAKGTTQKTW